MNEAFEANKEEPNLFELLWAFEKVCRMYLADTASYDVLLRASQDVVSSYNDKRQRYGQDLDELPLDQSRLLILCFLILHLAGQAKPGLSEQNISRILDPEISGADLAILINEISPDSQGDINYLIGSTIDDYA
jgi:hypothetical protein